MDDRYYAEHTAFMDALRIVGLPPSARSLWYVLAHQAETWGWDMPISLKASTLSDLVGVHRSTINTARNDLKNARLIDFKNGKKGEAAKYTIFRPSRVYASRQTTYPATYPATHTATHPATHTANIYIPTNNIVRDSITSHETTHTATYADNQPQEWLNLDEATTIQQGMDAVERLAREIGLNANDYGTINRLVAGYTVTWVLEALNRARANAKGIPSWKYVERILENWRKNGGIDDGIKPALQADQDALDSKQREEERTLARLRGEMPQ